MQKIEHRVNNKISAEQFIDLLERSTLVARRARSAQGGSRQSHRHRLGWRQIDRYRPFADRFLFLLLSIRFGRGQAASAFGHRQGTRAAHTRRGGSGLHAAPALRAGRDGVLPESWF